MACLPRLKVGASPAPTWLPARGQQTQIAAGNSGYGGYRKVGDPAIGAGRHPLRCYGG